MILSDIITYGDDIIDIQSMYIPVETSIRTSLLRLVNEVFTGLFLTRLKNQSISRGREGEEGREGGRREREREGKWERKERRKGG